MLGALSSCKRMEFLSVQKYKYPAFERMSWRRLWLLHKQPTSPKKRQSWDLFTESLGPVSSLIFDLHYMGRGIIVEICLHSVHFIICKLLGLWFHYNRGDLGQWGCGGATVPKEKRGRGRGPLMRRVKGQGRVQGSVQRGRGNCGKGNPGKGNTGIKSHLKGRGH